jgi:hypothetical protein
LIKEKAYLVSKLDELLFYNFEIPVIVKGGYVEAVKFTEKSLSKRTCTNEKT